MKETSEIKYKIERISLKRIRGNPNQRPMRKEDIVALSKAMAAEGQRDPIDVVRKGMMRQFETIDGGHRGEAAKLLGWKSVMCRVVDRADAAIVESSANIHRADVSVLRRADYIAKYAAAKRLIGVPTGGHQPHDRGISRASKALGFSRATIARAFKISKLEPTVKTLLEERRLDNATTFLEHLCRMDDEANRVQAVLNFGNASERASKKKNTRKSNDSVFDCDEMASPRKINSIFKSSRCAKLLDRVEDQAKVEFIVMTFPDRLLREAVHLLDE